MIVIKLNEINLVPLGGFYVFNNLFSLLYHKIIIILKHLIL